MPTERFVVRACRSTEIVQAASTAASATASAGAASVASTAAGLPPRQASPSSWTTSQPQLSSLKVGGSAAAKERGEFLDRHDSRKSATTESTKPSAVSSSVREGGKSKENGGISQERKVGRRFNVFDLLRRHRPLSEARLRKRVCRHSERGDWDAVRKLIENYEFSDVPEGATKRAQKKLASLVPPPSEHEGGSSGSSAGRTSYASKKRRTLSSEVSSAAAAAIRATLLEESSSRSPESEWINLGESILHDVCRRDPPLDVLETLLGALRHRRGSVAGTDDSGRTPLHVAASSGASPEIVDALVCTDPGPASTGDADGRSPLHLAAKFLASDACRSRNVRLRRGWKAAAEDRTKVVSKAIDRTHQTILILKGAMHSYPGLVDFKDKDATGYSPLDYILDSSLANEELIQTFIRRKEPSRPTNLRKYSSRTILLEQDGIEDRLQRIQAIKAQRQEEFEEGHLLDLFGTKDNPIPPKQEDDERPSQTVQTSKVDKSIKEHPDSPKRTVGNQPYQHVQISQADKPSEERAKIKEQPIVRPVAMTDKEIYNQHMQDYLENYENDFEGLERWDYEVTDDGFDIMEDPSLDEGSSNEVQFIVEDSIEENDSETIPTSVTVTAGSDSGLSLSEISSPPSCADGSDIPQKCSECTLLDTVHSSFSKLNITP